MEEWLDNPILQRAWELAEELDPPVISAFHLLYGLLKIAEDAGVRSGPFSSSRVLHHIQNAPESDFQPVEIPPKWARRDPREGTRWSRLFWPGEPGWLMCRGLMVDPEDFHQAIEALPEQGGRLEWMSDWRLLETLLQSPEHPVAIFLAERYVDLPSALEWVRNNRRLYSRFAAVTPAEVDLTDLIAHFAGLPQLSVLHWETREPPRAPRPALRFIGHFADALRVCVSECGHRTVYPIHQFLTGLRQPKHQLDYAFARRPVQEFLAEVRGGWESGVSAEAQHVLDVLSEICQSLNVDAHPLHLTWAAMRAPDELLERALRRIDCDRLLTALEGELLGQLPDTPLKVDGILLRTPGAELGPLHAASPRGRWRTEGGTLVRLDADGLVTGLKGRCLSSRGETLLDDRCGYHRAEQLVGLARPNRWIPVLGGNLCINTGQGGVESVELSLE